MRQSRCTAIKANGEPCGHPPMLESVMCYWHDPKNAEAAMEARRLGGRRRRRERSLDGAYEFEGLSGPQDLKRILEIATYDALALENSTSRVRVLIALVQAGAKLFEVTDLEQRLRNLEATMGPRLRAVGGRRP